MRKSIFFLSILCSLAIMADDSTYVSQQDSTAKRRQLITETMANAVVHQDSTITKLLNAFVNGAEDEMQEIPGFRVQIYSSNNQQVAKTEALTLEKQLSSQVDVPIYVQYNPPFWKIRLGNFRTQEEAQNYKNTFVSQHPELQGSTYIVRDQILIKK